MLFSGEPLPGTPNTLVGNLVITFILFMNATIFAMFTGTVSAFIVDKLRMEGQVTDWEQFSNHYKFKSKDYVVSLPIAGFNCEAS